MSTIRKTNLTASEKLTVVDLDISDGIRCGYCMPHLIRIVVASSKQVFALDLFTVMAESVTTGCKLSIFLLIGWLGRLSLAECLPLNI